MATTNITVNTADFNGNQRAAFMAGWEEAGGYTGDYDGPAPWAMPWCHGNTEISVSGETPEEWGASWWEQCRDEVEALLEEEALAV